MLRVKRVNRLGHPIRATLRIVRLTRLRLRVGLGVLLGLLALGVAACGSGGDASFCTEEYDPLGLFCDSEVERIDLASAEALARSQVPKDALLWQIRSSATLGLNPDGADFAWSFLYYLPGAAEPPDAHFVSVLAYPPDKSFVERVDAAESLACIPAEALPVLDSQRLVHDAIRAFEGEGLSVTLPDGGHLYMVMFHACDAASRPPLQFVRYRDRAAVFNGQSEIVGITEAPF